MIRFAGNSIYTARFATLLLAALVCLPSVLRAQELVQIPAMQAWATDTTGTLSAAELQALNAKLEAFKQKQGSQVAVLIISSTGLEPIEDYSIRLAEAWQVGREGVDDGVILLVAKDDRRLRVEVGYGAEAYIPDARAKRIIDELIVPYFKQGDFNAGINSGVDGILQLLEGGDFPPAPEFENSGEVSEGFGSLFMSFLVFGAFIGAAISFLKRLAYGVAVAVVFYFIGWLIFGQETAFMVVMSGVLFVFLQIAAAVFSMRGSGGGWYSSGGGWSSGGGGFSGGGFSGGFSGGGGGSFGGGGSSGSW